MTKQEQKAPKVFNRGELLEAIYRVKRHGKYYGKLKKLLVSRDLLEYVGITESEMNKIKLFTPPISLSIIDYFRLKSSDFK